DEVLKIIPVQKQTHAGQPIRFRAFVAIRDYNGHIGLGVNCSKEEATQGTRSASPTLSHDHCGSLLVCLILAPRGTGIVSAPVPKKLLMMAGMDNCYTSARGCTAWATLPRPLLMPFPRPTPDLWKETVFTKSPYEEFTDHLVKIHTRVSMQRTQTSA
ncbi:40s ribosomal protein s2-like, partial [Lynx pardinus]